MKIYDQLVKTKIRNIKQQQTELLRNLSKCNAVKSVEMQQQRRPILEI